MRHLFQRGIPKRKSSGTSHRRKSVVLKRAIFPLLASLRALVGYDKTGKAYWKSDAVRFFEKYGGELVATLIEQLEMLGGNPQTAGKKKPVYTALHDRSRLLLSDEMNS